MEDAMKHSMGVVHTSICLTLCPLIAVAVLSPVPGAAQTFGSVVGTVSDASGGVVAGAKATLVNLDTSERHATETDTSGNYRFLNLIPGRYKVDIEAAGFKHLTRDQILVAVQSDVRI